MAKIFCSKELVIITVNETIFFFDFEYHDYQLNLLFKKAVSIDFVPKIATDSQNNLDVDCSDQGKTVNCEEKLGDNKDKSVDKQLDKQILGGSFSDDGTLFAVITAQKACIVYRTEGERLKLAQFILPKAPTSVVFDKTGEHVIVADRAVDDNFQKAGEVLLGHCSMVLCVAISSCGNYICSSDRDEKIRISRYPESYVI
uniref:WD repeat-containing protein 45 n=1 Tax=Syphacia muris TaxID=451379 RepID=A0A0N5AFS6_9BILA